MLRTVAVRAAPHLLQTAEGAVCRENGAAAARAPGAGTATWAGRWHRVS